MDEQAVRQLLGQTMAQAQQNHEAALQAQSDGFTAQVRQAEQRHVQAMRDQHQAASLEIDQLR